MAVGHDAASESTVSTSVASFSWTHVGTASAMGVIVFVLSVAATFKDTSVTYGGIPMNLFGSGIDTDTEPGGIRGYYLDAPLTGSQTVLVNRVNDATQMMGMAATVTANNLTEAHGPGRITGGGSTIGPFGVDNSGTGTAAHAEVTITDDSPGSVSLRYAAGYTGAASPPTAGANSTLLNNHDFSAFGWTMVRETNAGTGGRNVGMTSGADDHALVAIAVREKPRVPRFIPYSQILAH